MHAGVYHFTTFVNIQLFYGHQERMLRIIFKIDNNIYIYIYTYIHVYTLNIHFCFIPKHLYEQRNIYILCDICHLYTVFMILM